MTSGFGGESPVLEGDLIGGKYRVEGVIGRGGMGVVVAASHVDLDAKVAIKLLHAGASRDNNVVARFLQEARAARKIQSEHVVRVSDVGALDDGIPYIVMERLEGADLARVLRTRGPLPIEAAVDLVLQICEALAEAHSLGVIHRDLKPANLFVTTRTDGTPCVKILDFGISKIITDHDTLALTQTEVAMGSPLYMSPEQLQSARDVDIRADIWALGVILFELLTNRLPFSGDDVARLSIQIVLAKPASLRQHRPEAPLDLEAVIAHCLEKRRSLRYDNVGTLAQALAPFASPSGVASIERVGRILRMHEVTARRIAESKRSPEPESNDGRTSLVLPWMKSGSPDVTLTGERITNSGPRSTGARKASTTSGRAIEPRSKPVPQGVWAAALVAFAIVAVATIGLFDARSSKRPAASATGVTETLSPSPTPLTQSPPSRVDPSAPVEPVAPTPNTTDAIVASVVASAAPSGAIEGAAGAPSIVSSVSPAPSSSAGGVAMGSRVSPPAVKNASTKSPTGGKVVTPIKTADPSIY